MADGADITGTDYYAPQEAAIANLIAQQQAQYRLAETQTASGNPLGGAIASERAPQFGAAAVEKLQQLTPEKMADLNDYTAALNHRDETGVFNPWAYAAANPDMRPGAKARVLTASPEQIAIDRERLANAALTGQDVQYGAIGLPAAQRIGARIGARSGEQPPPGGGGAAPGGGAASAGGRFTPPTVTPAAGGAGAGGETKFPGAETAAGAAADTTTLPAATAPGPAGWANMPLEQKQAYYRAWRARQQQQAQTQAAATP